MSVATLTAVVGVALVLLTVALNHLHARLALVEVALNEGLPPGHERSGTRSNTTATPVVAAAVVARLGNGLHIFMSRSCHACQRLIEELEGAPRSDFAPVMLHYVDRSRPIASAAADALGAELRNHQSELANAVGADPLPYTIAVGRHGLVARGVTPTMRHVFDVARDAALAPSSGEPSQ